MEQVWLNTPAPEAGGRMALDAAVELAAGIAARYEISAVSGLLEGARALAGEDDIGIAVLGRFKAGKSSFLNHFLGRDFLPVGVVPVTAVVTEIRYGSREQARVQGHDGAVAEVPVEGIGAYISEKENPANVKQARLITVEAPALRRFRGLKFIDTPGLESALAHNTQTSLDWLPNVGLALVAVSADPSLSARDLELLKNIYRYTPKVAILLTKADLLGGGELREVVEFVGEQLARHFPSAPRIFPYSVKPGFERFREALESELRLGTLNRLAAERHAILVRKLDTVLQELGGYLALSLKSAELRDSERRALRQQLVGEEEAVGDLRSTIRLLVQHAAAGTRSMAANRLEAHQDEIARTLLAAFEGEFPKWSRSLATMLSSFEQWLANALREELAALSARERHALAAPLNRVRKQAQRALQQFRDRLSDRTMRVFGVPLRTTETEIRVAEPATPDIRIGRVFDRNWELLSPILPAGLIRRAVERHFARTVSYLVYENLSRLAAQWEEGINGALRSIEKESFRRLDELLATIGRLLENSGELAPELRADLDRLEAMRQSLAAN
jgi:GTP-binding protein EngB required for normal cell division